MSDERPQDLNDHRMWIDKGNLAEALDAIKNQVTVIVASEQVSRTQQLTRMGEEQRAYNHELATALERLVLGLKTDLTDFRITFQEQIDTRLDAYGIELDRQREQTQAMCALVEERTRPFSELPDEILIINDRLRVIEEKAKVAAPGPEWEAAFNRALDERLREQRRYLVIRIVAATTVISVIIHFALFLRM